MAGVDKTFAPVRGQPLVAHTLDRFEQFPPVTEIVLVVSADSWELGCALVRRRKYRKVSQVCVGGARRQDSVRAGLDALQPCDWVMVHDGSRPGLILRLFQLSIGSGRARSTGTGVSPSSGKRPISSPTPPGSGIASTTS